VTANATSVSTTAGPAPARAAPSLLFIAQNPAFFVSHRLQLAVAARAAGYNVTVASPNGDAVAAILATGATHRLIDLSRGSRNPLTELRSLWSILAALHELRPNLIHVVTPKPILYGGLLARALGIPTIVAVSGLGHVFGQTGFAASLLKRAVGFGYRLAVNGPNSHVIFQNRDDLAAFQRGGMMSHDRFSMLPGSGVDLKVIMPHPLPAGPTVVLLPARLIHDKGVGDFVRAARILRDGGTSAVFRLLGDPDPANPTSVTSAELAAWVAEGVVEWQPYTHDMDRALADCHIVALPSYYREGLPKTLIDAAAAGRAAVTTDLPGCRDAIAPGETGLLCRARDPDDLAAKLGQLIDDPALQQRMGQAARRRAEALFDVDDITAAHLALYSSALDRPRRTDHPAKPSGGAA